MNKYTVANARKLYCDIKELKRCRHMAKLWINAKEKSSSWTAEIESKAQEQYRENSYKIYLSLKELADYSWYIRIWARLTYKL